MDSNDRYEVLKLLVEKMTEYLDSDERIRLEYRGKQFSFEHTDEGWQLKVLEQVKL